MGKYHGTGEIIKKYKTLKPKKEMCAGCYNDFYNGEGAKECWSFPKAEVVDVMAYPNIHCVKPVKYKKTLSCYRGVNN